MVILARQAPPVPDYKIINAIRETATPDFQRRVPKATQANVSESIKSLLDNTPARNEFISALMNRIGRVIGRDVSWSNPMAKFKIGMLEHGDTIEEIMVGLIEARTYDVNRDYMERDLYGQERPYVQSSFHKVNRRDQYKFTLNEAELRKAFLPGDGFGITAFVQQVMSAATKSDNFDEYIVMMNLFRQNYDNGGFFKVQVPDVADPSSTERDAKTMLRAIRTYSNNLKTISELYNAAKMPVAATADELELFLPNEVDAALDVEALASMFNVDRGDVHARKTVAPLKDYNIPGLQAVLTTRDFFVVADTYYEVAELPNPAGRYRNYWLHHDQIISMSRFAPTILFTTEEQTPIYLNDSMPTSIDDVSVIGADEVAVTEVTRGSTYYVTCEVTLDNPAGENDAVIYTVSGNTSQETRIDAGIGGLYVAESEKAEELKITATATADGSVSETVVTVVDGDRLQLWPYEGIVEDEAGA